VAAYIETRVQKKSINDYDVTRNGAMGMEDPKVCQSHDKDAD